MRAGYTRNALPGHLKFYSGINILKLRGDNNIMNKQQKVYVLERLKQVGEYDIISSVVHASTNYKELVTLLIRMNHLLVIEPNYDYNSSLCPTTLKEDTIPRLTEEYLREDGTVRFHAYTLDDNKCVKYTTRYAIQVF